MSGKVIVFGATGEIGSRVSAGCVQAGYQVTGVSRGSNNRHTVDSAGVSMFYGNQYNETFIKQVASKNTFDTVIATKTTLEGAKLLHKYFHDVENILLCSSTGTFVPLMNFPADEKHSWREKTSVNFHDQSVRDAWSLDRHQEDGFPVTILRPTCIAGYGRVPLELWGGRDIDFFQKLRDNQPVVVPERYDQILLQAGCNNDVATAFVNAVGKGKPIHGEIFILSCLKAITLKTYLDTAMDCLGSTSEVQPLTIDELLKFDFVGEKGLRFLIEHMCFTIEKAQRVLNYRPQYTAQETLIRGLQWCQETELL